MSILKELMEMIIEQDCEECNCEPVYVDEAGNIFEADDEHIIQEAQGASAVAFRRKGTEVKRQFRCMAGEKKGRLVANPKTCIQRKNPKRMVVGKRVAQSKKGIRLRKSAITRNTAASKTTRKMNKRIKQHKAQR